MNKISENILVAIPMYNCQTQIIRVLKKFDATTSSIFKEVLIIDNRSTDESIASCKKILSSITGIKTNLIRNNENYGLGGSHKVAFNYALKNGYDYVVILHGDDQGDIRDIIPFLQNQDHHKFDCLLGARFMRGSTLINYSKFRILGNLVFNALFSLACGRILHDLGAGLNIYKTSFLTNKFYLRFPNRLTFNYYMLLYTLSTHAKFKFFPLSWREEDQVSNVKLFKQTRELVNILIKYSLQRKKFVMNPGEKLIEYQFEQITSN